MEFNFVQVLTYCIIENLIEKRFCNYSNSELRDAMVDGTFKKIYNEIIDRVFN